MIFYQATLNKIKKENLIDSFLLNQDNVDIRYFNFIDHPEINNFFGALDVIEEKRKSLENPDKHTFLCLDFIYNGICNFETLKATNDGIAEAINKNFNNDLFIISFIYQDAYNTMRSVICVSDIEKSLSKSTEHLLTDEEVHQLITDTFPHLDVQEASYEAIYVFKGTTRDLPYNGTFHVKTIITVKEEVTVNP